MGLIKHPAYKKIAELMRITGEIYFQSNGLHKEAKVAYNTNCFKVKLGQGIAKEILNHISDL